jgi:hypothetical protein
MSWKLNTQEANGSACVKIVCCDYDDTHFFVSHTTDVAIKSDMQFSLISSTPSKAPYNFLAIWAILNNIMPHGSLTVCNNFFMVR